MNKKILYEQAYHQLNKCTPLRIDCGRLCNKVCCNELEEVAGMLLFPGEAELLQSSDLITIRETQMRDDNGTTVLMAQCNGRCERNLRPLACRLFPLTPYITSKDMLTIIIDPRAKRVCPIARDKNELSPEFIRNVRKTCQAILADDEIKSYMRWLSKLLDEHQDVADLFSR